MTRSTLPIRTLARTSVRRRPSRAAKLRLDTLENREQPGSVFDGLALTLGGAGMIEPLRVMAEVVGPNELTPLPTPTSVPTGRTEPTNPVVPPPPFLSSSWLAPRRPVMDGESRLPSVESPRPNVTGLEIDDLLVPAEVPPARPADDAGGGLSGVGSGANSTAPASPSSTTPSPTDAVASPTDAGLAPAHDTRAPSNTIRETKATGSPAVRASNQTTRVWVESVDSADGRGFRVWRDGSAGDLSVRYRLATGTAAPTLGHADITDGNRSAAVVVPGGADARIALLPGRGYRPVIVTRASLGRASTATPQVSIRADTTTILAGSADAAAVTLTRTSVVGDLEVRYTVGGTAEPGTDYGDLTGTVAFSDGEDRATVWVRPVAGMHRNGHATVELTVEANDDYHIGPEGSAVVLIQDPASDDPVLPNRGTAGGPAADGWSSNPVRYWDGKVWYQAVDLSSEGFGGPWAVRRSWSNLPGYANDAYVGSGWIDINAPRLLKAPSPIDSIVLVQGGDQATYFNDVSGSYVPQSFTTDQLRYDSSPGEFVMTDAGGNLWRFFDPANTSLPELQRGQLKTHTDRYGNVTEVTGWRTDGKPDEVQRAYTAGGTTTTESYLYAYVSGGTNDGLLESITLRRRVGSGSWGTVRKVEYAYYDGTTSNGNAGNLKSAVVKDGAGTALRTDYYRYYTASGTGAFPGGLKYAFRADSYVRLNAWADANSTTVDAATDTQIAPYADHYFEYDSTSKRPTKEVAKGAGASGTNGGQGVFTFAYTAASTSGGVNDWYWKAVETLPDGNQNIVYTNQLGGVLLSAFKEVATENQWVTYNHFQSDGKVEWTAYPSAVTGFSDSYADLLNFSLGASSYLRDDAGLFELTDYYGSTTATSSSAGGVDGYYEGTSLRRGEGGTAVPQSLVEYYTRTSGSVTIYPLATTTGYRNDNGTGGQTTSFGYTWGSGFGPQSVTVTLPTVTIGQNGPGSAAARTAVFDSLGNPAWLKDADSFLHYSEFDPVTGAVVKSIEDVDATQTGTFANLPSGWSTPSGGGLHLTSTAEVDALARTTKYTDPNQNATYYTYDDLNHELRTYPGWNTSTDTPTGPTVVTRDDWARGYSEVLTMSATPTVSSGRPTGTESVSGVQTLARDHSNAGGQLVNRDEYFDLTGFTYSTSASLGTEGTHFSRTQFGYDASGLPNRMLSPAGTVYREWRDALGRESSRWVGLDDTPTSGAWSPTNTTGTDLVKTSESEYDGGGIGNGNLTRYTEYPGGSATARRNDFSFDWRDRLVAVKSGVETSESTSVNRPIQYFDLDNLGQVTKERTYDGDGVTLTTTDGVPQPPSSSLLRAQVGHSFDEAGREYRTETFGVNPSSGSVSSTALAVNVWFDKRDNPIKRSDPGGLVTKDTFDGARRVTVEYLTDGGGDSAFADADDVTGDAVLTQTAWTVDANGNPILVTVRDRFHDETGTGALGTPTTGVKARVSYTGFYYDKADRLTAGVNVGTNGGSSWTRPSSVPSRSDTVLVTDYGYNAAGWVSDVTDPRGILNKTSFDAAGRVTKTVENYVNGTVSDADDKTITFTYNPNGVAVRPTT